MANIAPDVRTYLLTKSTISGVVGTRIYANKLPEKNVTYPCIVMALVTQLPQHHLQGGAGYAESRVQLDVYSTTAAARDSLAEALRDELQGYSGAMGSSTVSSCVCRSIRDLYEEPIDASDVGLYRNSSDYWMRHSQAVPTFAA